MSADPLANVLPTRPSITSSAWRLLPLGDRDQVEIVERSEGAAGAITYAVKKGHDVLNHDGEWEHEWSPSNRDDAFLARCRFATWDAASWAAMRAAREILDRRRNAWAAAQEGEGR